MEAPINITAVSGWALPPHWFHDQVKQYFPNARIRVVSPSSPGDPTEAGELLHSDSTDLYIGYSLGSLWLMKYKDLLLKEARKALLAPILAFTQEKDMGGKTSHSQLTYMIKLLKRNPGNNAPLLDFYKSCELPFPESFLKDIPGKDVLVRGLEFLLSTSVPAESAADFLPILGENDIFIEAFELNRHIPHLQIVDDAGHAPDKLIQRLAKIMGLKK